MLSHTFTLSPAPLACTCTLSGTALSGLTAAHLCSQRPPHFPILSTPLSPPHLHHWRAYAHLQKLLYWGDREATVLTTAPTLPTPPHSHLHNWRAHAHFRELLYLGRQRGNDRHAFPHFHILTCTTGVHMHTLRNCSIWGDRGAPPLTMTLTRPPSLCLILLNTIRSETTDACRKDGKSEWNRGQRMRQSKLCMTSQPLLDLVNPNQIRDDGCCRGLSDAK